MIGESGLFAEVLGKLKRYDSWVILCHENPDGDTLGSAFALYSLGRRDGKSVLIFSRDRLPEVFSFFPFSEELRAGSELTPREAAGALLVAVDISTERRAPADMRNCWRPARTPST